VRVVAAPDGAGVRVEVSDRGPGIPPGERERLFEPFFRGARAQERQLPGVGLGLHLVRRAAAAHGGRVEVRSAAGEGSTFALVLPRAAEGAA
jgi:signal transduction histidine kinase